VRAALRARHGSRRTEKAYVDWTRRYILFHGKRHPAEMGATEITQFLSALAVDLAKHLEVVRAQHEADLRQGAGWVELPWALAHKYPNAGRAWGWQWVFPATRTYLHRDTGQRRRHHLHESVLQRAVKGAMQRAGLTKHASCHTFRHSFAARGRPRHPHRAGTPGPPGRQHDDDLHARPQPRSGRRPEPRRPHDRALTGPDYPGLCNTGTVGMKTQGKDLMPKGILGTRSAPPARISLTGLAGYAGLSRSRYF
jgi:hypothetical protein